MERALGLVFVYQKWGFGGGEKVQGGAELRSAGQPGATVLRKTWNGATAPCLAANYGSERIG